MNYPMLREILERHEGNSKYVYTCTAGKPTIGIGHNLENGLHEDVIRHQFNIDIFETIQDCERLFPNWHKLPDVKQVVLANMMFNLGYNRLSSFKRMRAAIEQMDFKTASVEMCDSKWCVQVGDRCTELSELMRA